MTRFADGWPPSGPPPIRGETQLIEQAARDAWAWTDDDEHDRLPHRITVPIVAALSLALWGAVVGIILVVAS